MKRLLFIFFFLISALAFAQIDPPEDQDDIPVDGGVGFLLAAGAAWGIKKLKEKN